MAKTSRLNSHGDKWEVSFKEKTSPWLKFIIICWLNIQCDKALHSFIQQRERFRSDSRQPMHVLCTSFWLYLNCISSQWTIQFYRQEGRGC